MWRAIWFVCLVLAGVLLIPLSARGAESPLIGPLRVLRAYGETYQRADGTSASHSGLDLYGESGSSIHSVSDGIVVFAGSVPSATGSTHVAITVETADGTKWSYSPVEAAVVSSGAAVKAGDTLGFLAGQGDASAPEPHLHIGLRISGEYRDPAGCFPMPGAQAQEALPGASAGGVADSVASVDIEATSGSLNSHPVADVPAVSVTQATAVSNPAMVVPVGVAAGYKAAQDLTAYKPSPALIRDSGVVARSVFLQDVPAASAQFSSPTPVTAARRLAPALVAAAVLFVGYLKRPRPCCVTAQGDTVAAAVSR